MIPASLNTVFVGGAGKYPILLDLYPGASVAYSVRKLNSSYTGFCMQIRRSSDSTTQDIGFDDEGYVDVAAISSFCGAGSGYLRTWYDQSGNGNNLVNTVAGTTQPLVYNSGSLVTQNGFLMPRWTSSLNAIMSFSSTVTLDASLFSCLMAYKLATGTSNGMYVGNNANNSCGMCAGRYSDANIYVKKPNQVGRVYTSGEGASAAHLFNGFSTATADTSTGIREDRDVRTTSSAGLTSNASGAMNFLGAWRAGGTTRNSDSSCYEFVLYNGVDKSSDFTAIETNIMEYYGIT